MILNENASLAEEAQHEPSVCWCGAVLHLITYGDNDYPECPIHGSAFKSDATRLEWEVDTLTLPEST